MVAVASTAQVKRLTGRVDAFSASTFLNNRCSRHSRYSRCEDFKDSATCRTRERKFAYYSQMEWLVERKKEKTRKKLHVLCEIN